MLAMQYSFTLPADYDMAIIRRRISDNGRRMDSLPDLAFKAFLHANRDPQGRGTPENLYAPFYLWKSSAGMNRFLASPGFATLTASFGWPSVTCPSSKIGWCLTSYFPMGWYGLAKSFLFGFQHC